MGGERRIRGRRSPRAGDRGASLVEFALVMPLLFLLLLGTLTGGLTLSRQNSVKNAVREGSRLGAVLPIGTTPTDLDVYLDAVAQQAVDGATGDLAPTTAGRYICAAFIKADGSMRRVVLDGSGSPSRSNAACFVDSRPEARVQVLARRTSDIEALFFNQTVTLESRATARYER